ncbi:MAG TPA: adenosine deaminase [Clostridiales bacterium]|nr:adenosine deaminase [Clostridiales bacterium]
MNDDSKLFLEALHENSLEKMIKVPKSDLHNHVGRGGNIKYLSKLTAGDIIPPSKSFESLDDMQTWFESNIKAHFPGLEGYLRRVEASFIQASYDNIKVLSMIYSIYEIEFLGGIEPFIRIMNGFHKKHAPDTLFYPELVLRETDDIDNELARLDDIFSYQWFKSVDWQGYEQSRNITLVKPFLRKAKECGLKLRAHAGEFQDADYIKRCVEELDLDEVHHGINAVNSTTVMKFLADNRIQLNVCPTSNIMLKRSKSYAEHQIRQLYDYGIKLTINTDDLLIFNSSVSEEYLKLFNAKVMSDVELDIIRRTGLMSQ